MQGLRHQLDFRGIGVNVHLPSVVLNGHGWIELRYLLRHLLYTVSTCKWVTIRSGWFESSWSKRLTADLSTTAHDAISRIFGVDTFRLDFSVVLGLPRKRCSTAQGGRNVDRNLRCVDRPSVERGSLDDDGAHSRC